MNVEEIRDYCLSLPGADESLPFDDCTPVFKVGGKMFALLSLDEVPFLNLKCDPAQAIELREEHPAITPGYHMSKKHWNTLLIDGSISPKLIAELIDHSYELVLRSLTADAKKKISRSKQ